MKKKYFTILALLLGILAILFIQLTEFVFVSPSVNTDVLPYIAKTIKKIDKGINYSISAMNKSGYKMSILYKNAYGSGFLKNNPAPNDLDYSVGIYLGEYAYNGKNSEEIAKNLEEKMSTFQSQFYDYIYNLKDKSLISNYDVMTSIIELSDKKEANIKSISASLDKAAEGKEYIIHTTKSFPDRPDVKMPYPFVMRKNEILIEDSSPVQLFTRDIKYYQNTKKFLREITVVLDFFVDIKDEKTAKTNRIELVAESFVGQRLQLSRRFFPPIVFIGENSANYLKNLDYLNDNEKYLEYRLFNFKRHLQEFANLKRSNDRPVKMLKRILQCTELISPALEKDKKDRIQKVISANLHKPEIKIMNDYTTKLGNLIQMTQLEKIFYQAYETGGIKEMLNEMDSDLKELKSMNSLNPKDINSLMTFQKWIYDEAKSLKNRNDLIIFSESLLIKMDSYNKNITNIFDQAIENKAEIYSFIEDFNEVYKKAGFHKVEMYWLNESTIGVLKDDFTQKIAPAELNGMALENKLVDVNYKFITKSQIPLICVRYSTWIRYNPTLQEEKNWQNMRNKLLEDKKNFNIKRKFVF